MSDWSSDECSADLPDWMEPYNSRYRRRADRVGASASDQVLSTRVRRASQYVPVSPLLAGSSAVASAGNRNSPVDRTSLASGKSVLVSVALGGRLFLKQKNHSTFFYSLFIFY